MKNTSFVLFLLMGLLFGACKTRPAGSAVALSAKQDLIILDSVAASAAVIVDAQEGFFEQVGILDMSIQMRRNYAEDVSREEVLKDYRLFLQQDVGTFSKAEKQNLQEVFRQAYELCQKINPDIFPKKLQLIKSKGQPYGPMTFYTREQIIVIPEGLLGDAAGLLDVALHEIFHIYSRYHPEKREALYGLIGFARLSKEYLDLPKPLQERLLLNPDGIDYGYRIQLKTTDEKKIQAIPLIVSKYPSFNAGQNTFFSYLQFNLYQIKAPYTSRIPVLADQDGGSLLNLKEIPDFFAQIKDNTGYIIHPDEILADNFMFLATGKMNSGPFSDGGKKLLQQIEEVLKQP